MFDDPGASRVKEAERELRKMGRMPRCSQCGNEASQVCHDEVGLGGDDFEGMMMGLAYKEVGAYCFARLCKNSCSSCSRPLCYDCQVFCANRDCSQFKANKQPACKRCASQHRFSKCQFCDELRCRACTRPECQDCGELTCPRCTRQFGSNKPVCQQCFFRCKCGRVSEVASGRTCTTCKGLRCSRCSVECIDRSAPQCCSWVNCETCGHQKCQSCPLEHSCAILLEDEDNPVSWRHDSSLACGPRYVDQMAVDVGGAVLFLKNEQMNKCAAQLYDCRSQTTASFHLLFPSATVPKLIPTRFSPTIDTSRNTMSAVGHERKLFFFDGATNSFCVIDLADTPPYSQVALLWKPFDASRMSADGEVFLGFTVLACGPARGFNPLSRHGEDMVLAVCRCSGGSCFITLHFFSAETGTFSKEITRIRVRDQQQTLVTETVKAAVKGDHCFVVAGTSCWSIRMGLSSQAIHSPTPQLPSAAIDSQREKRPRPRVLGLTFGSCGRVFVLTSFSFRAAAQIHMWKPGTEEWKLVKSHCKVYRSTTLASCGAHLYVPGGIIAHADSSDCSREAQEVVVLRVRRAAVHQNRTRRSSPQASGRPVVERRTVAVSEVFYSQDSVARTLGEAQPTLASL